MATGIAALAAVVILVVTEVFPAGALGISAGILLGDGLADAWERGRARRFEREHGRRLLGLTNTTLLRRDYFAAP